MISSSFVWSSGRSTNRARSILISNASLVFITDYPPLFDSSPSNNGSFDLVIGYRETSSEGCEPLSLLEGPFVHIGELVVSRCEDPLLEFCIQKPGFERCIGRDGIRIRSVIVRSPGEGSYTFPGSLDGIPGRFEASDGTSDIAMNSSFIDILSFRRPGLSDCRSASPPKTKRLARTRESDGSGEGSSAGLIGGLVSAFLLLGVAAVAGVVFYMRFRRREPSAGTEPEPEPERDAEVPSI
jgi:hypothetical protein